MIEAGLGGRYDATNVIPSKVQVLTGVGLEHTRWLGPTLADIAGEKLAVVPDRGRLWRVELDPESLAVAERVAAERHARLVRREPPAASCRCAPPADFSAATSRSRRRRPRRSSEGRSTGRRSRPQRRRRSFPAGWRSWPSGRSRCSTVPTTRCPALAASLDAVLGERRPRWR